jgi:glutamyl-tRNA synthetase/nondiscriminating glutamyl-tRNA synthetase
MNSESSVRVRFAPSPTGFLHVGNVRTALFNWLLAGHCQGTFILRIEDTDAERSKPEYEQQLQNDLLWLGLEWGEGIGREGAFGPYRQSDRYEIYQKYAQRLLATDKAFRCFCTEEELERVREQQLGNKETTVYSGKCRNLSAVEIEARIKSGVPFTLRLRVRPGMVGFTDLVFGKIDIETAQISDPVLLRSDGSPTYNFCCVIDDSLMHITHVVRGDGHLSNTHRQILIYEALGSPVPQFAHLSTILGPDGQKLSKRHGATSVEEFQRQGYLPQALVNYLALLGWSPPVDGQEIMSLEEITSQFDLDRVLKSPATFDNAKLDWMNRSYINKADSAALVDISYPFFIEAGLVPEQAAIEVRAWLAQAIDLVKSHVDHLDQLPREAGIVFGFATDPPEIDEGAREALGTPEGKAVALEFRRLVDEKGNLTVESYREIVAQVKANTKQKGRNLFHPIRAALTGRGSGPEMEKLIPLYESGSRLCLPRKVMSCRERIHAVLG